MFIYTKILVATDGSDDAMRATLKAKSFQEKWNSEIVIFHSIEHSILEYVSYPHLPLLGTYGSYTSTMVSRTQNELAKITKGEQILEEAETMFDKTSGPIETRLIKDEAPEDYIERIVKEENFDLVILGCKGHHSKFKQIIMGTVAQKALNNALCDVLVVR